MKQPTRAYFLVTFLIALCIIFYASKTYLWALQMFVVAPFLWTFQEYWAHRSLLHGVLFQRSHLSHHRHPSNQDKIFIPMEVTLGFGFINFWIFYRSLGLQTALNTLSSFILCYHVFEYTHWKAHQKHYNKFCNFHIMHHGASSTNFGFTSATWDIVFNTCDPKFKQSWVLLIPFPILPFLFV
jgi:sterol desaturase/sphingolipid hydroxylase (fatty acid hydroxylase superfamily)